MVTITIMMTISMTTMRTRKAFIISQKFLKPSFRVGSKVKKSKKKKSKNQKMSTTKKPKGSSNYRQSVLTVIVIEGSDLLIVK